MWALNQEKVWQYLVLPVSYCKIFPHKNTLALIVKDNAKNHYRGVRITFRISHHTLYTDRWLSHFEGVTFVPHGPHQTISVTFRINWETASTLYPKTTATRLICMYVYIVYAQSLSTNRIQQSTTTTRNLWRHWAPAKCAKVWFECCRRA